MYDQSREAGKYYKMAVTKTRLYELLGFANELYFEENKNISRRPYPTSYSLKEFNMDAMKLFNTTLNRALSALSRDKNIIYNNKIMIISNEDGNHRIATEAEENKIVEIEGKILHSFDAKNEFDIILKNKTIEYYKKLQEATLKELNIYGHYRVVEIRVIKSIVKDNLEKILDSTLNYEDPQPVLWKYFARNKLNGTIVETMLKRNQKLSDKLENGELNDFVTQRLLLEFDKDSYYKGFENLKEKTK